MRFKITRGGSAPSGLLGDGGELALELSQLREQRLLLALELPERARRVRVGVAQGGELLVQLQLRVLRRLRLPARALLDASLELEHHLTQLLQLCRTCTLEQYGYE